MNNTKKQLKDYESFLSNVRLENYRIKYQPIKIVEMDMPKNIQALDILYRIYWEEKSFLPYDDFYTLYEKEYSVPLEEFRTKIQMCKNCFYLGLPARIYRTWASIITQIQAGYLAQDVFKNSIVNMNAELDRKGADFQVIYKNNILNFQVKKESFSREVRQAKISKKKIEGEFINLFYNVPTRQIFENPKKKDGNYRKPYLDFQNNKTLKRLNNGFVIFTEKVFEDNQLCSSLLKSK